MAMRYHDGKLQNKVMLYNLSFLEPKFWLKESWFREFPCGLLWKTPAKSGKVESCVFTFQKEAVFVPLEALRRVPLVWCPDTAGGLLHPIRQRIITVPHAINNIKNVRNLPHAPQSFHFLSAHLVSFLFVVHSNSLLSSSTLSCLHRPTRSFCVSFYCHLSEPHRC
jgi:hypothetical protein